MTYKMGTKFEITQCRGPLGGKGEAQTDTESLSYVR